MAANSGRFGSRPPKACGRRYRKSIVATPSRTIACSCSVAGRPLRRARVPAGIDFSAIRPGPRALRPLVGKPFTDGEDFFTVPRQGLHELRIKMPAGVLLPVDERPLDAPRRV